MSLAVSMPLVLAFGVAIILLHKFSGLKWWHAAVCALFGFYVAASTFAPAVTEFVGRILRLMSG